MYLWTDDRKVGMKISYDANATPAPSSAPSAGASGSLDANASMNYKCGSWIADASMFTLPAGITFGTFNMPTQTAPKTGASGSSSQCSYCDSLTGDSKTKFLTALKCN